jgi:hypothetical protein
LRNTIEAELAEADLSTPIKEASKEFKQIGKELTDMPSFNSENQKPETKTPDPVPEDVPEKRSAGEQRSGKSEDV